MSHNYLDDKRYIFFDVGNTLLHKNEVYVLIHKILLKHQNLSLRLEQIKRQHRLLSETIIAPHKPDYEFYSVFNSELLVALGAVPEKKVVDEIYNESKKIKWKPFSDLQPLLDYRGEVGILSNWDLSLRSQLSHLITRSFFAIFCSEELNLAKPNPEIFKRVIDDLGCDPEEILYVGDSLKLDYLPAVSMGIDAVIIDRDNIYPFFSGKKIINMYELFNKR